VAPSLRATLSLATLNLSGVPPFALFFGKLPVALALAERGWLLPVALLLAAGVVAVAYAFGLLAALWFWGLPAEAAATPATPAATAAAPLAWLLPPAFLALAAPALLAEGTAAPAAAPALALPTLATLPLLGLLLGLAAEAAAAPARRRSAGAGLALLAAPAAPALDYPPLLTLGALAAALVLLLAAVARLLGSHPRLASQGRAPASAYECGFVPYAGLVSGSLFVFFRLAVFFVVFEAELIFLLPWATSLLPAAEAGALRPFLAPLAFLVALAYGFGREVRGGALALLRRAPGRLFEVVLWEGPFGAVLGRLLRRRPVPPPNFPPPLLLLPSPPTPDRKPAFALPRALG
jgi:NADH-quinone oxidoreductase subunit A